MRQDREADVAVVGMACRLPGGITDPDGYWDLLAAGRGTVGTVPADRWGGTFHHPSPENPGTSYSALGSFLDDVDRFDADFFGISPREAVEMDPQQRLLLATSWAAMEDSGTPREKWSGSRTGVFMGILAMDYMVLHAKTVGTGGINPYFASGKEFSFGAGRISYTFGLRGPSLMLNTACSSSLMAVHQAVRSLRTGESDAALAGGVNLMLTPELSVYMSKVWALSPTGACRPFDAAADGIVRSEGCGVVVLKRYADAVAQGDRIWAVIHGSAANHDGRSAGLTAPNAAAQQDLLREALRDARRESSEVDYVEAHGTGTPLGDPLELSALAEVFGPDRPSGRPLYVGSHKANFGHMDSAAGISGLIKAVLVARHGAVPPQPNLECLTPQIDWEASRLAAVTEPTELRPVCDRVLAGVSAFGLSGTNVHVVLSAEPEPVADQDPEPVRIPVLTVSGHTPAALRAQAAAYQDRIRRAGESDLGDLLHTANVRRTRHDHRLAVVGRTGPELADLLAGHLAGESSPSILTGDTVEGTGRPVVHAFSGQGSQWPRMGLDLYGVQPLFTETIEECEELFASLAGWSLMDELRRTDDSRLADTAVAQPAIFAIQVGLSRLWSSWGLAPDAVVGHSMGEAAAAVAAGVLSLPAAAELIVQRGRLLAEAAGSGRMAAVELPADRVSSVLEQFGGEVVLAVVNGPTSVVIAGPDDAVSRAVVALRAVGAQCVPLAGAYAFHSPAVHTHGDELERLLRGSLRPAPPTITFRSSVDPGVDVPVVDAAYWGRNVRDRVDFWPAVDGLLAQHDAVFIEVGVHPVLGRPLRAASAWRKRTGPVVSSLKRGEPADLWLGRALAALDVAGAPVEWAAVDPVRRRHVPLPPLPLAGDRFWLPGVERGAQGGARSESQAGPPAEVRLYDAAGELLGTYTGSATTPAAKPALASIPAPAPIVQEPVQAPAAVPPRTPEPAVERREQIATAVSRIAAQALGHDPGRRVPRVRGFFELGMDSFSLSDFVKALEREFGVELGEGAGISYPTVDQLTDRIHTLLAQRPSAPSPVPVAATVPATAPGPIASSEPIAIVGMACRLPGADGIAEFWRLLTEGLDASGEIPADRFDAEALLAAGPATPGTIVTRRGAFLDRVDEFDNAFFRISAREARSMDPQQRLFLEVAFEALEDAGVNTTALHGRRDVGLYVGMNTTDYGQTVTRAAADVDLYYGTGNAFSGTPGRLSYFLGVRGPSLAVDTACSSSLTAVHLACQALRAGEAALAVAGGVNIMTTPTVYLAMSAAGALAPDGRCKTFSADADGYGRGEGAGAVILKPLSRARVDGDRIYAVLRGSAVNHNGASGGLTVPGGQAQGEVIADALDRAGIKPAEVGYVEAHGTGTRLGDGVELTALADALGPGREPGRRLLVGSVKTNIGHLEAAAGIAGLIKTALAVQHGVLPAHLHATEPTRQVDWDSIPIEVATGPRPWPTGDGADGARRVAGVSAFGFTGTNAHVVVTDAEPETPVARPLARPAMLALSGAADSALLASVERMRARLDGASDEEIAAICYTAGARRAHLEHRLVAVGRDGAELRAVLAAYAAGRAGEAVYTGSAMPSEPRRFALVYGDTVPDLPWNEWNETEPAFAAALDTVGDSARRALLAGSARHGDPVAVLAGQIALTALWRDYGLRPDRYVGRGRGEIAAALASGRLPSAQEAVHAVGGQSEWSAPSVSSASSVETASEYLLDVGFGPATVDQPAHALAELHVNGCVVDWTRATDGPRSVVSLPSYPWQRRRHWIGSSAETVRSVPEAPPTDEAVHSVAEATLADELAALEPRLRADRVLAPVLDAVATALGESRGSDVDPDLGFFDMGLDSVLAVALMDQLGPLFGLVLEPTLTFEHPTPRALAGHLLDTISPTLPEPGAPEPVEPDAPLTELSDDDLVSRLMNRIASSEALLDEAGHR
jgi:acyl transferase domain-containing protein